MAILICGLNGAGKSTIGSILAERMSLPFIDNEDVYFPKTDSSYAYSNPRSDAEAIRILETFIDKNDRFVCVPLKKTLKPCFPCWNPESVKNTRGFSPQFLIPNSSLSKGGSPI